VYLFPYIPRIGQLVPSPLIVIIVLTAIVLAMGIDVRTIGDLGELPDSLPIFLIPNVPFSLETLWIILPYSVAIAIVGLLESLMTAQVLDEMTDTDSDKARECKGQGVANIASSFTGGMAGCAMIGQSVINIKSGGRGRLSTFTAGAVLLIMVVFVADYLAVVPMAALVAIMIMVSIGTFSWVSIPEMRTNPWSATVVMLTTVIITLWTHNLAFGVISGVILAALFMAYRMTQFMTVASDFDSDTNTRTYCVIGDVFFNSTDKFISYFDFKEAVDKVIIDLNNAHFWDISATYALDKVVIKLRREGADVEVIGLNEASQSLVNRYAVHQDPKKSAKLMGDH
jgi:SulP family sulfate permease